MRAPRQLVCGLQSGAGGRVSARHTNYGFHTLQALAAFPCTQCFCRDCRQAGSRSTPAGRLSSVEC